MQGLIVFEKIFFLLFSIIVTNSSVFKIFLIFLFLTIFFAILYASFSSPKIFIIRVKSSSLKLLTTSRAILKNRGKKILNYQFKKKIKDFDIRLVNSEVEAGSGSLPEKLINSMAISFQPKSISVNDLAKKFRLGRIPVVGYIKENKFYIDLKAVLPNQVNKLAKAIKEV